MSHRSLGSAAVGLRGFLQTAFRMVPWPTEPGLRAVGEPGESSSVIVTCNYDLTVRRVLRALEGVDAWVVVAPSKGINVWCAASGGHLGTHQVVTALKTSGVAECVSHRRAILPQLSATGVEAREVSQRCGWKVRFGPVYAEDLPDFLAAGGGRGAKTEAMRRIRFGARDRLEMAMSWGVPAAFLVGATALLLRPAFALPLAALALLLAMAVFAIYDRLPGPRRWLFGGLAVAVSLMATAWAGGGIAALATAAGCATLLAGVLTFDYPGSTPTEGGSHFAEHSWSVVLDRERCDGVYSCWEVCPRACYEKPAGEGAGADRRIALTHPERCVRCGACVVQCPVDALCFEDEGGSRIEPDTIRRFKLNLMGQRSVNASLS
jgi:NAD-dependent dihydropyrimidine dehydrogenase PreA subunit